MSGGRADDDEPFLRRWSRRKRQQSSGSSAEALRPGDGIAATDRGPPHLEAATSTTPPEPAIATSETKQEKAASVVEHEAPQPLTEADFADVDFDKLGYGSDYGRFMQKGVPEAVRQKALSKLWLSDPIFSQVDPFQDYAGDYTDSAVVPKGVLRTAYKVGQGFLSNDEAQEWHRLGKPALTETMTALPLLRPGYRVRNATVDDADAMLAVHRSAVLDIAAASCGAARAETWAASKSADSYRQLIAAGAQFELAIEEDGGAVVAYASNSADRLMALYVRGGDARRGIGAALTERAMAAIGARQFQRAVVEAHPNARDFYERQRFFVVSERAIVDELGNVVAVLDMARWLVDASAVDIARETPDQPAVAAFFTASEAYMGALYPAESNHFAPVTSLLDDNVTFLVARIGTIAVGCGAIVRKDDASGEIKRMWVDPAARGLKIGSTLLSALLAAARENGLRTLLLETGILQTEAIGLYHSAGFTERGPFGDYAHDPLSLFMEKALD